MSICCMTMNNSWVQPHSWRCQLNEDKAPYVKQERLFLQVRFFSEEIGLDVQWLSGIRAVLLRDKIITSVERSSTSGAG
ncbi:stalk domain-containing protein [Paenibacillus spongiae]|uniref:stalk domain-containing protein n=1 Tax=Paenibacillus spongiae TaxID=2909671 RepID=UPI0035A23948